MDSLRLPCSLLPFPEPYSVISFPWSVLTFEFSVSSGTFPSPKNNSSKDYPSPRSFSEEVLPLVDLVTIFFFLTLQLSFCHLQLRLFARLLVLSHLLELFYVSAIVNFSVELNSIKRCFCLIINTNSWAPPRLLNQNL